MTQQRKVASAAVWFLLAALSAGCLPVPNPGPPPTVGPSPALRKPVQETDAVSVAAVQDTVRRDPVIRPWPMVFGPVEATPLPRQTRRAGPDDIRATSDSASAADSVARAGSPSDPASAAAGDSQAAGVHDTLDPAAASTLRPAPPEVAVDLPPSARLRMERTALRDIALADSLTRRSALRTLPQNQRDKLETSLGLIEQAREALVRGDVPGAANLAFKARLIAEEVANRR